MRRALLRLVMAAVGAGALFVYAGGAYLTYLLLQRVWADRPSAATVVALVVVVSLLAGYASYRYGTRRLLETVERVQPTGERVARLADRTDEFCSRMDLEGPAVVFTDPGEPNAFSMSGPDGGVVVLDVALFSLLDDAELGAVLAHELAHLESHDGLVQLLAFTGLQTVMSVVSLTLLPALLLLSGVAKASAWLRGRPATWSRSLAWRLRTLLVAFVTILPAICTFVLLVRSRRREYAADERAAEATGNPLALASALATVRGATAERLRLEGLVPAGGHPAETDPLYRLLSTHPAVEDRIARLEALAARGRSP